MPLVRRSRRFSAALIPAVLLAALATGCGGGGDGAPPSQSGAEPGSGTALAEAPDACGLIPGADLEQALGAPIDTAEPGQPFATAAVRQSACAWRAKDGTAGASLALRQGPTYAPDADAFDAYASGYEENLGTRPEVQRVEGLGSAALWDATNHVLLVRPSRAGYEFNVQPYVSTSVPMLSLAQARAIAEAALRRLE
jgi:hypothetical protein